jgi:hypothetical protein
MILILEKTNKTKEIQAFLLGFIWICLDGIRRLVVFVRRGSPMRRVLRSYLGR